MEYFNSSQVTAVDRWRVVVYLKYTMTRVRSNCPCHRNLVPVDGLLGCSVLEDRYSAAPNRPRLVNRINFGPLRFLALPRSFRFPNRRPRCPNMLTC